VADPCLPLNPPGGNPLWLKVAYGILIVILGTDLIHRALCCGYAWWWRLFLALLALVATAVTVMCVCYWP
jgi:hypothetical protein